MTIHLQPTTKCVDLVTPTGTVPARIWEGATASGIPVHAFITRIGVARDQDQSEFERELEEQRPPSALVDQTYPSRLVL